MLFAILFPLVVLKIIFMDKAEKKKKQLAHNEEIVFFGASRKKEDRRNPKRDFQQDAQKHSYLWLYEEED
jgi:hypothetical protein